MKTVNAIIKSITFVLRFLEKTNEKKMTTNKMATATVQPAHHGYTISACTGTDDELQGILVLQCANRPEALTAEERASQGFVTARHDVALLRDMNAFLPHIVARDPITNEVIGYALSLVPTFDIDRIPYLQGFKSQIASSTCQSHSVATSRHYLIMGQVCVSKAWRGHGMFAALYRALRQLASSDDNNYDCIVTAVSTQNPRSLRAHGKVGFVRIREFTDNHNHIWVVLLWDIAKKRPPADAALPLT